MNRSSTVLSCVAALALASSAALAQFNVGTPDNDVWVYPHAGNPGGDPVIRLWGDGVNDINPTGYPGTLETQPYFSHGFFSWDLSRVPGNWRWNGATITLTVTPDTNYDPQRYDVYLRLLSDSFDEFTWVYGVGPYPIPGVNNRVRGDDSRAANGPGSTITFRIPRSVPSNILQSWARNRRMNFAITCTADYLTQRQIIRVASEENALYNGPQLVLE